MKLEVEMFVRTKKGIAKITSIYKEPNQNIIYTDIDYAFENYLSNYNNEWLCDEVSKASNDIIDLIEPGDFIGNYIVEEVYDYENKTRTIFLSNGFDEVDNDYILENGVYLWKEVTIDEARVLSLANGELDTGDNKRRVFVGEPITPYETGDIWLNNGVFYRCRATRNEGLFESVDWCTSSEYKDDYYLKNIEAVLNQFIRTVTTDYATRVSLETTKDSINANVSSITTKITNDYQEIVGKINVYDEKVEQQIHDMSTKLTDTEFKITSINKTLENGITKVETETGYTFGSDGLKIGNSESIVNNTLDENGMSIATGIENVLFAGYDKETQETIVKSKNMTVEKYLVIPSSRFESYENPTFGEATGAFSIDN